MPIVRKNSSSSIKKHRKNSGQFQKAKRKMSIGEKNLNRKEEKKYRDMTNEKIYGNKPYPEIKYK